MTVRIEKFDKDKKQKLKDKADEVWGFEDWMEDKDYMQATMRNNLVGGESEEEFAERLTRELWLAHGDSGFCQVEVTATYLEELPCDTYFFDGDDYNKFVRFGDCKDA